MDETESTKEARERWTRELCTRYSQYVVDGKKREARKVLDQHPGMLEEMMAHFEYMADHAKYAQSEIRKAIKRRQPITNTPPKKLIIPADKAPEAYAVVQSGVRGNGIDPREVHEISG
jgi:hypothetical protein